MQKIINKKLDLPEARRRIAYANDHKVATSVALIMGFPEEMREDLRGTVEFFLNATRYDYAEPQLSLLAPLAKTPIERIYQEELVFDNLFSNISHQGYRQDQEDLTLIRDYPVVFPNFYGVPTQHIERAYFKEVHDFVFGVTLWFRWLPLGLMQDSGNFLNVCDLWLSWRDDFCRTAFEKDGAPYYARSEFRDDFIKFTEEEYIPRVAKFPELMQVLVRVEDGAWNGNLETTDQGCVHGPENISGPSYPYRLPLLKELELGWDFGELVKCLRNGSELSNVSRRPVSVVVRRVGQKEVDVRQLPPLLASLLALCDGKKTVEDIAELLAARNFGPEGISPVKACFFGLKTLADDGLIGLSPSAREAALPTVEEACDGS